MEEEEEGLWRAQPDAGMPREARRRHPSVSPTCDVPPTSCTKEFTFLLLCSNHLFFPVIF